ncbi:MAG: hypothetical protein M3500_03270, partial [Actinomycetota bacterium]|nr:hypothetical protein [Actinomycetota bacterium]
MELIISGPWCFPGTRITLQRSCTTWVTSAHTSDGHSVRDRLFPGDLGVFVITTARRGVGTSLLVLGMILSAPSSALGQPPSPDDDGIVDAASAYETAGDPGQHGRIEGHLPPRRENVELVSKLRLTGVEDGIADVTVFEDTAYLAAFRGECGSSGVHIVDISDVENPVKTGFIPTDVGSFVGEGVQVITVRTLRFQGDVLIFNNELCGESETPTGGATMVDVTDP